jgi:propane monooxygenase large subunit
MSTTSPKRRSITKTHGRIAQLGWEPEYFTPAVRYPSRYTFPKNAKDPMKQIMREYLPMELEKDERVYGGHDAGVRADVPNKAHERWLEILKVFLQVTNYAEIGAGRCMSMLIEAVPNNELRNGYHVQFVDEIRHTGMQMSLGRWYAKHVPDPAGWNIGAQAVTRSSIGHAGINMLSHFIVGDPIQCAFTLQVVAETAFTNVVFVALPDVGSRNGDFVLPTTYHSVQSDEARHISNGYATMLTVLQDDRNVPLIERDLQQAWWINHAFLDVFGGAVMEYFSRDRSDNESFLDKWDRWVRDDWYRSYVLKLGKLGLNISPDIFERARERIVKGLIHKNAMFAFATWPMQFWRFDTLDEQDFEWFEAHYPGWYDEYGMFWEANRELSDPAGRALMLQGLMDGAPPLCWTCTLPSVIEEDLCHRVVGDRTRFYCSKECKWLDESNPGRYGGDRNYLDRYHGREISEVVRELGFVRSDGKTPIGQPHLKETGRWTLDDLKAIGLEIISPNIAMAERMGLPNGSSYRPEIHGNGRHTNLQGNGSQATVPPAAGKR